MKKIVGIAILLLVCGSILCGTVAAAEEPVSAGPPDVAGDGIPDGNQFIQPDAPGPGPAPSAGDGESEGPEWS
jgi:hypothetical protein